MSDVLVTGASGFLGRHVARAFAKAGARVSGVGHGAWTAAEWRGWGLESWTDADVTAASVAAVARGARVIAHCAGGSSVALSVEHPELDRARTVDTTRAVLAHARGTAGTTVVLPSSAAVYGRARAQPIEESSELAPVSPYGRHKLEAEELCRAAAREDRLGVAIVRFFSVYGEGLRKQLLWDACRKARAGEREFGGTGRETRDLLHVTDAAELFVQAASHASPEAPVANGGTGIAPTTQEIVGVVFGAMRGGDPIFNGVARAGDPEHYQAATKRARAWGWSPRVAWKDGVRAYADWHRKTVP